jgi:ribosomal protein S13
MPIKLDGKIKRALTDLIAGIGSAAADAALDEVQKKVRAGVKEVDNRISHVRSRVKKKPVDDDVIDAEFEETHRR